MSFPILFPFLKHVQLSIISGTSGSRTERLRFSFLISPLSIIISAAITTFVSVTAFAFAYGAVVIAKLTYPWLWYSIMAIALIAIVGIMWKSSATCIVILTCMVVLPLIYAIVCLVSGYALAAVTIPFINLGAFVFSAVTSLGIALVSVFVGLMEIVRWGAWYFENTAIWHYLSFERKPTLASAIIVIVMFTILYWPIAVLLALES
jgi:hypothetical protein